MPPRLTNRFAPFPQLVPEQDEGSAALVDLVRSLGVDGSVFYLVDFIPDQYEDYYTLLCDDQYVVSFELPRRSVLLCVDEFSKLTVKDYRIKIGQGKRRIRLDETLKIARALLDRQGGVL